MLSFVVVLSVVALGLQAYLASASLEECHEAGAAAGSRACVQREEVATGGRGVVVCEADRVVTSSRVVAVADVHGDLERLEQALELAGLVTPGPRAEERHWAGGDAVLVQTGDIIDRGPDTVRIFEWLSRLRSEAVEAGGCVVQLLGNHELMNLAGDLRYADAQETAQFGGIAARRRKLDAGSSLGDFLRALPVAARVTQLDVEADPAEDDYSNKNGPGGGGGGAAAGGSPEKENEEESFKGTAFTTIFAHAGVPAWLASTHSVSDINKDVRQLLMGSSERQVQRHSVTNKLLLGQGLLWTRRYAEPNEREVCAELYQMLSSLKAHRMLVGHTVQQTGRPTIRCEGRLVLADTGMSRAYGGGLSVVELQPWLTS
ncbi:Shewanella-like protein phosphatase 2 [Hondaea fermentalgiana]|uniref:Shewanella-like protein phosphatase 2 n=1 Tax=Hondaea fermentalgiana TaxID=2315210 RepID=A0A2R5GM61_9STRA|nr:Shewanella-like protein phosphatase 2 [Hondaea fermentalgiana]|eukprot:GBG31715.1 Shewanella-like protein phosphatase 2 [Hondaea fermentalgiana]